MTQPAEGEDTDDIFGLCVALILACRGDDPHAVMALVDQVPVHELDTLIAGLATMANDLGIAAAAGSDAAWQAALHAWIPGQQLVIRNA